MLSLWGWWAADSEHVGWLAVQPASQLPASILSASVQPASQLPTSQLPTSAQEGVAQSYGRRARAARGIFEPAGSVRGALLEAQNRRRKAKPPPLLLASAQALNPPRNRINADWDARVRTRRLITN